VNTPLISAASPKAGEWIITAKGNKQTGAILYDPKKAKKDQKYNPPWLIVRGWPHGFYYPTLKWDEFTTDKNADDAIITSSESPDKGQKKYKKCRNFYASNYTIGTRQERVRRLKKIEVHPAVVEAISLDAANLEIILFIAIEIFDPILLLDLDDDFLDFAATFVTGAFRLWSAQKTFKENRAIDTDIDIDDPKALTEKMLEKKNLAPEIWDKIKKLNKKKFIPLGFKVNHVAVLLVTVKESSKGFLESEGRIAMAANDAQAAVFIKDAALQENEAQDAFNTTEIKFREADAKIKTNLIKDTSQAIKEQNAAWGGPTGLDRLFLGSGPTNGPGQAILEETMKAQDYADDNTDRRRTMGNKKFKNFKNKNQKTDKPDTQDQSGKEGGDDK
jgi:hypothetical protein